MSVHIEERFSARLALRCAQWAERWFPDSWVFAAVAVVVVALAATLLGTPASGCLLYTSPSPRDVEESRMPSSA